MTEDDIRAYLGAELARVAQGDDDRRAHARAAERRASSTRCASSASTYVLTGHAHSNRVVDHGGLIELNTEPLLMGGLDFTPAGYRVVTIDGGRLASYAPHHRRRAAARDRRAGARRARRRAAASCIVAAELDARRSRSSPRASTARRRSRCAGAGGWTGARRCRRCAPARTRSTSRRDAPTGSARDAPRRSRSARPAPPRRRVARLAAARRRPDARRRARARARAAARRAVDAPRSAATCCGAAGDRGGTVYVATTDLGDGDARRRRRARPRDRRACAGARRRAAPVRGGARGARRPSSSSRADRRHRARPRRRDRRACAGATSSSHRRRAGGRRDVRRAAPPTAATCSSATSARSPRSPAIGAPAVARRSGARRHRQPVARGDRDRRWHRGRRRSTARSAASIAWDRATGRELWRIDGEDASRSTRRR